MCDESTFLQSLILVSEKAANIARAIRYENDLLSLLIREKKDGEKNPRFEHDFKTLTDVLVQEVVRNDLGKQYPPLINYICGEESREFTSLDGQTLNLQIGETEEETAEQLVMILGDVNSAKLLAKHVHSTVSLTDINVSAVPADLNDELPIDKLGIWIDPIDSTAEYINGGCTMREELCVSGLPCVTVLIGAFNRDTGLPVAGVINQPFYCEIVNNWYGRCVWGLSWNDLHVSSISLENITTKKLVVISSSENPDVKSRLELGGFNLIKLPGAGYKLLCVALGLVDAFVLSRGSTYFWDTCGPGAVLKSLGGAIVDYTSTVNTEIRYIANIGVEECCNKGGIIAYRDKKVLDVLVRLLK